jgi:hypothetical protein
MQSEVIPTPSTSPEVKYLPGFIYNGMNVRYFTHSVASALADAQKNRTSMIFPLYNLYMATLTEIEKLIFELPKNQRVALASNLLKTLPSVWQDEDEGYAEAARRDAEMDANPEMSMSLEQLDEYVKNRK